MSDEATSIVEKAQVMVRMRPHVDGDGTRKKTVAQPYSNEVHFDPDVVADDDAYGELLPRQDEARKAKLMRHFARHRNLIFSGFNSVYGEEASTLSIYNEKIKPAVQRVLTGRSTNILAYGATGSGKTFTMLGSSSTSDAPALGVVQLALVDLFEMIALQPATTSVRVRVCALQLYQDNLLDLLPLDGVTGRPGTVMARPSLRIACASTSSTQPTVVGLKKHDVRNLAEVMALYKHAIAARSVAETGRNLTSSRSHCIFDVEVTVQTEDNLASALMGTLRFADLAGSERAADSYSTISSTGAGSRPADLDQRCKEGCKINSGLLAMKLCMRDVLTRQKPRTRLALLTRLLAGVFAGQSTFMFICVSGSDTDAEATISSLKFGVECSSLRTTSQAHVKRLSPSQLYALVTKLQAQVGANNAEIVKLRKENAMLRSEGAKPPTAAAVAAVDVSEAEVENSTVPATPTPFRDVSNSAANAPPLCTPTAPHSACGMPRGTPRPVSLPPTPRARKLKLSIGDCVRLYLYAHHLLNGGLTVLLLQSTMLQALEPAPTDHYARTLAISLHRALSSQVQPTGPPGYEHVDGLVRHVNATEGNFDKTGEASTFATLAVSVRRALERPRPGKAFDAFISEGYKKSL